MDEMIKEILGYIEGEIYSTFKMCDSYERAQNKGYRKALGNLRSFIWRLIWRRIREKFNMR